ncbi:hypothetical protein MHBO_003854 [Bonamia ostreae]|uniref:Uncharacterized protein n=1 Tax=Bonamia ostreae TaxID=126728 RepID=A0ABV2ASC3_9EUKA
MLNKFYILDLTLMANYTYTLLLADFVKKSMAHKLSTLLSDDPTISQYVKHRKLLKQHPGDTILKKSYEVALTNLQLAVSRKHMELMKRGHSTSLKYAEELMQYWGMYYF